ncbi:MAG TPA: hypothetical protein VGI34_08430, partial [Candidatus Acidoferrales bacterium]
MTLWNRLLARALLFAALLFLAATQTRPAATLPQGNLPAKSQKMPRPIPLGHGTPLSRDPVSGELHSATKDSTTVTSAGTIRSHVTLVQAPCTVAAPDGTEVRGLNQNDFRLFEDGMAQEIA